MSAGPAPRQTLQGLAATVIACRKCPRLIAHCRAIARVKRRAYQEWEYWGRPVPGFGDPRARVLVVGLAPGAHGANRTGRMFTGDGAGATLMASLHHCGYASQPESVSRDDGLVLTDLYLTAAVRCAPPDNRPLPAEVARCRPYLVAELTLLPRVRVVIALGRLAHEAFLRAAEEAGVIVPRPKAGFAHGAQIRLRWGARTLLLIDTYHPSRQNTQTGRLTPAMLDAVFRRAREALL
ncbi:MAG: uracil-DNA glycosylase [Armatimonadetes bacterium]|nr:uracil-DNA glycosylase [Armatimonadota bacterium]